MMLRLWHLFRGFAEQLQHMPGTGTVFLHIIITVIAAQVSAFFLNVSYQA